jgi:phosphoribosylanthranilate isomerase
MLCMPSISSSSIRERWHAEHALPEAKAKTMTFRVKICGITSARDAAAAAEAGADAVGLNFYRGSKRYVELDRAKEIVAAIPQGVTKVGVFVNADVSLIRTMQPALDLDMVQLHGDEPPEFLRELIEEGVPTPVMRAFACGADHSLAGVADYLARANDLGCPPRLVLLDAAVPGQQGGTGVTCDWSTAAAYHQLPVAPPLVLAGGLTPDNVAAAIAAVQPAAVDVASGVESSPGCKDAQLMRRFVAGALG